MTKSNIEYEAMFANVNKADLAKKLEEIGAKKHREEFLQKRSTFELPSEKRSDDTWLRVRDEGDRVTLALKSLKGEGIERQKEVQFDVSDFDQAVILLLEIGCARKSFQESKREVWMLGDVEVTIDSWPFLEDLCEVEADSEEKVVEVSEKLGFDYSKALHSSVNDLYKEKYGKTIEELTAEQKANFTFGAPNPFV